MYWGATESQWVSAGESLRDGGQHHSKFEMSVRPPVRMSIKLAVWLQGSALGKRCKKEVTNYPNAT